MTLIAGLLLSVCRAGWGQDMAATNPDPKRLPTLSVRIAREGGVTMPMVRAAFPNVPGFVCESWCYESELDYLGARALEGGRLELRHRDRRHPHVLIITVVTPEPRAVEFLARAEVDKERAPDGKVPDALPFTNMCWQLRPAPAFASAPDPYPEFIKRCFIFTEKGRTFLDSTTRRKIPVRPPEDPYNNPPWVQMYVGVWQDVPKAGPDQWADYSPDRYTLTVIGTVSRDGKYLAALANDSATVMAQAWHDCLHNNAQWQPASAPPEKRVWRVKIYAMEDNPTALLQRVVRDFPAIRRGEGKKEPNR